MTDAAAAPGKPGLAISPLAVPLPEMGVIDGVRLAIGHAGFYRHERPDLLLMAFDPGATAAGGTSSADAPAAPAAETSAKRPVPRVSRRAPCRLMSCLVMVRAHPAAGRPAGVSHFGYSPPAGHRPGLRPRPVALPACPRSRQRSRQSRVPCAP